ncbi:NgoFVII family restriction endonuclease [Geobacillus subterraneus]|uniref:NgoFVII family restriction endonuclease n=2 Tax=Geobacillus TaxID=129337 RepID=A0ABM6ACU0_9BACL|nr:MULTISPECIES: DUF881 domain-containing protein [Geobacillus]AMX84120.1 NgoFVII family restriction endonuclease [Geobacillus subterraneus]KZS24744.1 NgoFVII family restriction endonuclease [Geobacillus subterraneus]
MERKRRLSFAFVAAVFGVMLAVGLRTTMPSEGRDTRDIWELRADLTKEQQLEQHLLEELEDYEEKLHHYRQKEAAGGGAALEATVAELREEAGLTEVKGSGIILMIAPFSAAGYVGPVTATVSPELLQRLVNELNKYGAKEIAIDGERLTNWTAIRDINGMTNVGRRPIRLPVEVKAIADDADKLYSGLTVSPLRDDFIVENLELSISKPKPAIVIPPSIERPKIKYMETASAGKEEK